MRGTEDGFRLSLGHPNKRQRSHARMKRKKEDMKMKDYVLHFIQTYNLVDKNISSFWRCSADNYNHAVEQLRDEIERNQGERLILVEHYKS